MKARLENKAVELISHINAAVTNVRLYPPASELISKTISRLNDSIQGLLSEEPAITYAESEKKLLIQGEAVSEKVYKRPQVQSFLTMLLEMGIKSISFEKGLTEQELREFLHIAGSWQQGEEGGAGLKEKAEEKGVSHIKIDEKIYVERDADQSILAGMAISDAEIARAVFGGSPDTEEAMEYVRALAGNTEWLAKVFQEGVKQAMSSGSEQPGSRSADTYQQMLDRLEEMSDTDRREIISGILKFIPDMESSAMVSLLSQDMDRVFGRGVFRELVGTLNDERLKKLLKRTAEEAKKLPEEDAAPLRHTLAVMRSTDRAQELISSGRQPAGRQGYGQAGEKEGEQKGAKNAFSRLLKGDTGVLPEIRHASGLPRALEKLLAGAGGQRIDAAFNCLLEGIKSEDPDIKPAAAEIMGILDETLESAGRTDQRVKYAKQLLDWVKQEKVISEAFESISAKLQSLAESLIKQRRLQEASSILEAFQMIESGENSEDSALQALAANVLQNIATEDIINILLSEIDTQDREFSEAEAYSLVLLGTTTVERLLDRLRDSHNRSERNRVVQAVTRIGRPALKPVTERLGQEGPWYYLRNLILLLGRIGDEEQAEVLEKFLEHPDSRVQREAVFGLQNLCGENAGAPLLRHLDNVDDRVKPVVISVLGYINHRESLPYLAMKLQDRSFGSTRDARADINTKICEAFGRMGDSRAVPVLEKVARSRGFIGIKSYEPRVRQAAAKALEHIGGA